jgi:serine/threonine-protein kinase
MIGERLGTWVVSKELGRGGMGRVFLAQEELTGRKAAIKVLSPELAREPGFLHRFQREIETLSRLDHPGIVRFYEAGHENDRYFYAMEHVEGQSLEEAVAATGKLPWADVLDVARQVCPALRHVHDNGVIHRDLKPSNILRTADGVVKLTDFGIAKVFASRLLTATGGIIGSAEFLSPEQAAGKVVGKRSDIYSLGAVFYTLLTGRPPFTSGNYVDLLHKHRYAQFDRPAARVPEIPAEVDELVCRMLAKSPDDRPRDAFVLGKEIDRICRALERKGRHTDVPARADATLVDNAAEAEFAGKAGESTLTRAEAERHGGLLSRVFNHPLVLVTLLGACVGTLVWTFWPHSEHDLFERGAALMASDQRVDWERAWREYLEPLERRFPGHPYQEEVARFRQQLEASRAPAVPGEAQRFYQQGEALRQQGNVAAARDVWRGVVDAFGEVEAEKEWVRRAEGALVELEKNAGSTDRWAPARAALQRAAALRRGGKAAEARRIWDGLETLYRNDPAATGLLRDVQQARAGP